AHHAGAGRHGPTLWRVRRREHLHTAQQRAVEDEPRILGVRHRARTDPRGPVRARRRTWAERRPVAQIRLGQPAMKPGTPPALETRDLNKSFGALQVTRNV